ncbi:GerMN domain-containing protein [Neobacillus rhizophilus]|uniref:GerMN domain-containing protein n=1 Tax=Neobacillus rhizophilus TaxID=2833579 RepID=A0A942YVT9_9BACI|nr:GerMN domain-containing protein [Neobacillus rhizophilus]MBS4215443.1 GerMN domain-containing protein [Neobacillus rhizophilus]MBU8916661.1 GerMN domain-containing protein [Bacillus sp. FJAT-29953]
MFKNKAKILGLAVLTSTVVLSGCGLFGSETQKKIDPPKTVTTTSEKNTNKETAAVKKEKAENAMKTELYLIDKNGYVVPQTLNLPKTKSVAKQALDYLVVNGPVTDMLPNDFRAVLPEDTKPSVNIKDGVAVVDFSKEFKNYQPEDELKILQSVTWTLTQFAGVNSVKLKMNGHELTEMPVKGTPISEKLSRATGINLDTKDVVDITNTKPITVYFIGGEEGSYYYVPVTRRVKASEKDPITAAVNELIKGPSEKSNLVSQFMSDVKLNEAPKYQDGTVTLNFNKNIYGSFEEKVISQNLLDTLVLSLTEQKGVEKVAVLVDGKAELKNDKGKKLSAPVTRPEKVNTGSF